MFGGTPRDNFDWKNTSSYKQAEHLAQLCMESKDANKVLYINYNDGNRQCIDPWLLTGNTIRNERAQFCQPLDIELPDRKDFPTASEYEYELKTRLTDYFEEKLNEHGGGAKKGKVMSTKHAASKTPDGRAYLLKDNMPVLKSIGKGTASCVRWTADLFKDITLTGMRGSI